MSKQSCKTFQFDGDGKFTLGRRETRLNVFDNIQYQGAPHGTASSFEADKQEGSEDSSVHEAAGIYYGEPSETQQFVIDFTPIPGLDDDEALIDKITNFWLFVEQQPELKKFLVLPTPEESEAKTQSSSIEDPLKEEPKRKPTAAMPFLKRIDMILPPMSNVAKKGCLLEDLEVQPKFYGYDDTYDFDDATIFGNTDVSTLRFRDIHDESHDFRFKKERENNRKEFKQNCKEMAEFDKKNPKSFISPTRVSVITSVLQRHPVDPYLC